MAFQFLDIVSIIEIMENYVERIRPPEHIREKVDISYRIDKQSIILFEIRPLYRHPTKKIECEYAKATYVKKSGKWKVYWMPGNLKWELYITKNQINNLSLALRHKSKIFN